jgi:hypothetical protein
MHAMKFQFTSPLCVQTMFVGGSGEFFTMHVRLIVEPYSVKCVERTQMSDERCIMQHYSRTYEHLWHAHYECYRLCVVVVMMQLVLLVSR